MTAGNCLDKSSGQLSGQGRFPLGVYSDLVSWAIYIFSVRTYRLLTRYGLRLAWSEYSLIPTIYLVRHDDDDDDDGDDDDDDDNDEIKGKGKKQTIERH